MAYDVIVVGGGPAGLSAAKTAAEDGLKTILFEEKRSITRINRACSQIFYTRKLTPSGEPGSGSGKPLSDGYIEPVAAESRETFTRFHFPALRMHLDYTGPLRPYLNWYHVSPRGHRVNRYPRNYRPWGFYYRKETFLDDLLRQVEAAGAEIINGMKGVAAENTSGGTRLMVTDGSRVKTITGKTLIAADGLRSRVAETVGFNRDRKSWSGRRLSFMQYVMEGVETGFPDAGSSWFTWTLPSINPDGFIAIGLADQGRIKLGARVAGSSTPESVLVRFMQDSRYAPMFQRARVVKKEGTSKTRGFTEPIRDPVRGNVLITGDAGAINETWIQGAVASGYRAVKAIEEESAGGAGYEGYRNWWHQAFAFNTEEYARLVAQMYPLPKICDDEEIDYLWGLFEGQTGIPQLLISRSLDTIAREQPVLYQKLEKAIPR